MKGEVVPVLPRFEGRLLVFSGYESLMKRNSGPTYAAESRLCAWSMAFCERKMAPLRATDYAGLAQQGGSLEKMSGTAGRVWNRVAARVAQSSIGRSILPDKWAHGLDLLKERVDRFSPQQ